MNHSEKVAYFEQMLHDRGYRGYRLFDAMPPVWRLLWRLGFKTPPPYFLPFLTGTLSVGLPFGFFWGVAMWFFFWRLDTSVVTALVIVTAAGLTFGLTFGLSMARLWRIRSKELELPDWNSFPLRED